MPASKKKKENIPLSSMAGLIRYYDEDIERIKINPKAVIIASLVMIGLVIALTKLLPTP
ncbi:preprotein translocase subunit Sec61beta [Sulfuracidifex tepidarius]|uniref:Preprotein translocase subunit SecG n=1 Tax=Sulfuracidifex tepidarius TaxID=1294262 RepID=A0A510E5A6_9CREN|nr:preprotein translocase subunit Sec61beta [Sulfuracidifex tepidarius]BBG24470.1 hypothetical protein IC006_1790 [Sulfuracidifex tepidarius]BBG27228.1 hypothetical protein IC007_1768 [Sulfuracidifex tepidarius]